VSWLTPGNPVTNLSWQGIKLHSSDVTMVFVGCLDYSTLRTVFDRCLAPSPWTINLLSLSVWIT
jgi:hypothetical protein